MRLEEAIIHAEYVAESNEDMANAYHTDEGVYLREELKCRKCAEEHRQLTEWLKELRERRAKDKPRTEYERASEQREHDILYEPTYDLDNGSM